MIIIIVIRLKINTDDRNAQSIYQEVYFSHVQMKCYNIILGFPFSGMEERNYVSVFHTFRS